MADRKYYVICQSNCKYEGMTKEQTIAAIAEATGATPTNIDDAFITKIKDQNKGGVIKVWRGTVAEYNAITKKDGDTVYIKTDDSRDADVDAAIKALGADLETLMSRGIALKVDSVGFAMPSSMDNYKAQIKRKNLNAVAIPVITKARYFTDDGDANRTDIAVPLQINGDYLHAYNLYNNDIGMSVDIYEIGIYDGEVASGGAGGFRVNVETFDFNTGAATVDKSFAEIVEAFNAGQYVYVTVEGQLIAPLISIAAEAGAIFGIQMDGQAMSLIINNDDTAIFTVSETATLTEDDVNTLIDNKLGAIENGTY